MTEATKTTTQHTSGPWAANTHYGNARFIYGDDGATLVAEVSGVTGVDAARANAEFIIRACNAHDDLVAALLAVVAGAKNWSHGLQRKLDDGSKLTQWEETIRYNAQSMADMARAAIAKARGTE